jgi:hypothetical protein
MSGSGTAAHPARLDVLADDNRKIVRHGGQVQPAAKIATPALVAGKWRCGCAVSGAAGRRKFQIERNGFCAVPLSRRRKQDRSLCQSRRRTRIANSVPVFDEQAIRGAQSQHCLLVFRWRAPCAAISSWRF